MGGLLKTFPQKGAQKEFDDIQYSDLRVSIHCEKSWRKTPPAWPDVTDSLVRGTENFFDMKIELIRRVPTTKTEYFEIIGISRRFFVLPLRSFSTIFRQLSDEWIIKSSTSNLDPMSLRVTIHYSTTAPHSLYVKLCDSTNFSFLCTCLPSSVLCFPSSVLCLPSSVLC